MYKREDAFENKFFGSGVRVLPCKCKALSSNPSHTQTHTHTHTAIFKESLIVGELRFFHNRHESFEERDIFIGNHDLKLER
jgi:hypothetical protein